jgi:hypothetical protein
MRSLVVLLVVASYAPFMAGCGGVATPSPTQARQLQTWLGGGEAPSWGQTYLPS